MFRDGLWYLQEPPSPVPVKKKKQQPRRRVLWCLALLCVVVPLIIVLSVYLAARAAECPDATTAAASAASKTSTIKNKVLIGYQGWFAADPTGVPGRSLVWKHWSINHRFIPGPNNTEFDMFPEFSEYPPDSLHETNLLWRNGSKVRVFSSDDPAVVDVHFRWLAEYNLDGVLLQRFVNGLREGTAPLRHKNAVLANVNRSACEHDRVYALMYDITNSPLATWKSQIMTDWDKYGRAYTKSPCYLHENGKPVLSLYGLGLNNHPPEPTAADAVAFIRTLQEEVYLIGSGPYFWRSGRRDALPNYETVHAAFDAIMPWSVGRYRNPAGFANQFKNEVVPDHNLTASRGQGYAPITFPGFSFHNSHPTKPFNGIPRLGGAFFQAQVDAYLTLPNATFYYIAMFDEVNEGTAIFKTAATADDLPANQPFLHNSADGIPTPSDHYLTLSSRFTARAAARTPSDPEEEKKSRSPLCSMHTE